MHFHVSEQQCDVMVNSLTQAPDYCDVNSSAATCGYMTSGKVLILSVPRFPHLENGNNSGSQLCGVLWGFSH